ncbi:MAG: TraR/DksA C4-type zinc finger protein [Chloroflexi bacterium]|nr:TraR/DksA C4-type zinc finger protein [Chloroflexota bacterium]
MIEMSAEIRAKLEKELQEALAELEIIEKRLEHKADYGPGLGDPAIYDWEFNLALRERARQRIESIREALQKLERDRYGICERCGQPIEPERLEILPDTTLCVACARGRSMR